MHNESYYQDRNRCQMSLSSNHGDISYNAKSNHSFFCFLNDSFSSFCAGDDLCTYIVRHNQYKTTHGVASDHSHSKSEYNTINVLFCTYVSNLSISICDSVFVQFHSSLHTILRNDNYFIDDEIIMGMEDNLYGHSTNPSYPSIKLSDSLIHMSINLRIHSSRILMRPLISCQELTVNLPVISFITDTHLSLAMNIDIFHHFWCIIDEYTSNMVMSPYISNNISYIMVISKTCIYCHPNMSVIVPRYMFPSLCYPNEVDHITHRHKTLYKKRDYLVNTSKCRIKAAIDKCTLLSFTRCFQYLITGSVDKISSFIETGLKEDMSAKPYYCPDTSVVHPYTRYKANDIDNIRVRIIPNDYNMKSRDRLIIRPPKIVDAVLSCKKVLKTTENGKKNSLQGHKKKIQKVKVTTVRKKNNSFELNKDLNVQFADGKIRILFTKEIICVTELLFDNNVDTCVYTIISCLLSRLNSQSKHKPQLTYPDVSRRKERRISSTRRFYPLVESRGIFHRDGIERKKYLDIYGFLKDRKLFGEPQSSCYRSISRLFPARESVFRVSNSQSKKRSHHLNYSNKARAKSNTQKRSLTIFEFAKSNCRPTLTGPNVIVQSIRTLCSRINPIRSSRARSMSMCPRNRRCKPSKSLTVLPSTSHRNIPARAIVKGNNYSFIRNRKVPSHCPSKWNKSVPTNLRDINSKWRVQNAVIQNQYSLNEFANVNL